MKNIIISNKPRFDKIIEEIKKSWKDKIHILSDFDRTLTKNFCNWKNRPSLIWAMRQWGYLWDEYSKKAFELFDYYHPIEIDPKINLEYKKTEMKNWWTKHLKLLLDSKLHNRDIEKVINSWIINFREALIDFFNLLEKNNIPIIILSANWLWWDSIKMYLWKYNLMKKNIFVISNEFLWDKNWYAIWYKKNIIHVFNKDETLIKNFPKILKKIDSRENIILLWDSIWDIWMIKWTSYKNVLKIWFLNENEDILLEDYKKIYDVIITWDWDFSFVNKILEKILK